MIKITDISKKFKNELLYEQVNITIGEGEKVLITGENGSGKSVLLKMLVGFSKPTSGTIEIDGEILGDKVDFIQNGGVYINSPEFLNHLTGLENLLYLANIKKVMSETEIMELAEKLYFDKDIKKNYKVFSLGMKQKLRFIQALLDKPKYLILDEPFDALDAKSKKAMMNILSDYLNKDRTLIFTAHNPEVHSFANTIYKIDDENKTIQKV